MTRRDPRVLAWRADLAAEHLRGTKSADRHVRGREMQLRVSLAGLFEHSDGEAQRVSELLFGERFTVYDEADGWAWGQCATDGYVGYTAADGLTDALVDPTHVVGVLRTVAFSRPDLRSRPVAMLHMNSPVTVGAREGGYSAIAGGGWIPDRHLVCVDDPADDHVAVARMFLGAPYLWGGRSSLGVDCSGLVQLALARTGIRAPRDSDQQEAALGGTVDEAGTGDLVFTTGHVALVSAADRVLHANAHHMAVREEPLADFLARLDATGLAVSSIRRLPAAPHRPE